MCVSIVKSTAIYRYGHGLHTFDAVRRSAQRLSLIYILCTLTTLTTLEKRRQRGNLIEAYKIITDKEGIDSSKFFTVASSDHGLSRHNEMKVQ